jgi:hypothetical protein
MEEKLLKEFEVLLKERINYFKNFTSFGEDSIRYDFFASLMRTYDLKPHEILLEQAIPESQFVNKDKSVSLGRGRHDYKPEVDLIVPRLGLLQTGIVCEFAFFRGTEKSENQDKTGRHGKLLNEIYRLSLMKNYCDYNEFNHYLICITDNEMMNYGKEGTRGSTPIAISDSYSLDDNFLNQLKQTARTKIDDKFYNMTKKLGITPIAKRVHKKEFKDDKSADWAIWIWEVDYRKSD